MDIIHEAYFAGFGEILKNATPVSAIAEAAPKAEGLAQRLVGALRKRPILTAATAAAAGAGVATGLEESKAKKEDEERRRQQIRELLMARLSGS